MGPTRFVSWKRGNIHLNDFLQQFCSFGILLSFLKKGISIVLFGVYNFGLSLFSPPSGLVSMNSKKELPCDLSHLAVLYDLLITLKKPM